MTDEQQLNEILNQTKTMNLDVLLQAVLHEQDPAKQAVLKALYDYALDTRQTQVIKRRAFTI